MDGINLVIFASRENVQTLSLTFGQALRHCPAQTTVDVIINGNPALPHQLAPLRQHGDGQHRIHARVWEIAAADKANAWNQHIRHIWPKNTDAFYIDGYVRLERDSIGALQAALASHPQALASSGAPTVGRSARSLRDTMARDGGFHGNLCAIRRPALEKIIELDAHLPIGMYRVDALMGAYLAFGLNNTQRQWLPKVYTPVAFSATWDCDTKKWYSMDDLMAWQKRRERQARGRIENSAMKRLLTEELLSFDRIPTDVGQLFQRWAAQPATEFDHPQYKKAKAYLAAYRPPATTDLAPRLVREWGQ